MDGHLVDVRGLVAGYGGLAVVRDLTMHVDAGEIVALLGPNGAGKTTTLSTIAGILSPLAGDVDVLGASVGDASIDQIARRGLSLVTDDRGIFSQLTVAENLRLNAHRASSVTRDQVLGYFPELASMLTRRAGLLSGGEQQMLALGCKLIADPAVVMIDEMSLGLAPVVVERLLAQVRRVADETTTAFLIVEQHVRAALDIADRAYVLNHGRLVMSASASELLAQSGLLESSYLGERAIDLAAGRVTRGAAP